MTTQKNSNPGTNSPESSAQTKSSAQTNLKSQRSHAGTAEATRSNSQKSSENGSLFQRVYNNAWQRIGDTYEQIEQSVVENPKTSMAIPFAMGMGIGLLIGLSITSGTSQRRRSNGWFGREYLDSLTGHLPDSIKQRLRS